MRNVKKFRGLYTYGMSQGIFCVEHEICADRPKILICKLEPGMTTNLLTKIKCFLLTGEVVLHPILGALNKPSLRIVKKKYSSLPFAFTGILPLPGHSRFVKIYLIRQSLTAFCFSLRPPSSGYSCIRHYLLVPYGF